MSRIAEPTSARSPTLLAAIGNEEVYRRTTMTPGRSLGVLAVLLAALVFARLVSAQESAIPPGQEQVVADLLGRGVTLPGNCHWDGASIDRASVRARYACPGDVVFTLTLRDLSTHPDARIHTSEFAIDAPDAARWPPGLLDAVRARVANGEMRVRRVRPPRDLGLLFVAIAAVVSLTLALIAFIARALRPAPDIAGSPVTPTRLRWRDEPLPLAMAVAALIVNACVFPRVRFVDDDFSALVYSSNDAASDPSLRYFSVTLFTRAGLHFHGNIRFFALANFTACALACAPFFVLLRRARFHRGQALFATSLFALAPGLVDMLRYTSGFQQIGTIALIFTILLFVDSAARAPQVSSRIAHVAIALTLTSVGVYMKYPVMVVVPVLAWLWGTRIVKPSTPPLKYSVFYLSFVAALAVPMGLSTWSMSSTLPRGELGKVSLRAIPSNVLASLAILREPATLAFVAAIALLFFPAIPWIGAANDDASRRARPARPASWIWALAASISLSPYLLNGSYFADYYLVFAFAWMAALIAPWLSDLSLRANHGRAWTALAVLAFIPWQTLSRNFAPTPLNTVDAWLDDVAIACRPFSEPTRADFVPDCGSSELNVATSRWLSDLFVHMSDGVGVWWVTGWRRAEISTEGHSRLRPAQPGGHGELAIHVCRGRPLRVEWHPSPVEPAHTR